MSYKTAINFGTEMTYITVSLKTLITSTIFSA